MPGSQPSGIVFIEGLGINDKGIATCELGASQVRYGAASLCSRRAELTIGPLLLQTEDTDGHLRNAPEEQTVEALRSLGYLD